jgi:transposase
MRRTKQFYSDGFKKAVIQEVMDGIICKDEARRKYGIQGKCTVLKWIRKFEASKLNSMQASEKDSTSKSLQELEAENKRLLEELQLEQLRNRALNVMIDIAEEQLKIKIRKKSGAKQ